MHLDKVEIHGFKSFCDKQELDFRGGVTGIVGPNGCGKSNISDAISWVLGEQSVKSLRGQSMEDVIFAGSQARQPVGMAEVNLKVSGLNGNSPDGNPECTVTRRLYRNGESEYLMNGTVCRLRDIHELFMDTGLGSKAYSIIEQGKIGLILSSKPADRRALIEEAAGVTKYKLRRRQTALKLEAAQQNLLRVNDIVHEVEKQVESLKRQASKARRYRIVQEELKKVEGVLFGRRFLDLEELRGRIAARLTEEGEREQAASLALGAEEAQMEARRTLLYDEESRLEEARRHLGEITLAVDRHQGRSGYCKEQISETATRKAEAEKEAAELEARVEPLATSLGASRSDESGLRDQLALTEEASREAEGTVREASSSQAAAEGELDQVREAQVVTAGRLAALQNAREAVLRNSERAGADLLKLAGESDELSREEARVGDLFSKAQAREREVTALRENLDLLRVGAETRAQEARSRAEVLGKEADALQSERDSLQGRLSSLEEMVATHSAFDEGVRAVLARPAGMEVLGVVADLIETSSAHEKAVETVLGDLLEAVLTPDTTQALAGIAYLKESGAGRGAFLPLSRASLGIEPAAFREIARQEPGVVTLLSEVYTVTGPHEAAIRAALPDALVVGSLEEGLAIVERRGAVPCVTLTGETIRGALLGGGRGVKGLLAPRREIREISERLAQVHSLLSEVVEKGQAEAALAETAQGEARSLEERIHASEKDLVAVIHDLASADEETVRLKRKASILATERGQAEEEQAEAAARFREIQEALAAAEAERAQGTERLATVQARVAEARARTESAQARFAEVMSLAAALRERVSAAQAECLRLEREREELEERIRAARSHEEEMVRRGEDLARELKESEEKLAEALLLRSQKTEEAARVEETVRDLRNELEAREASLKERRRERETLRDALSELNVEKTRCDSDLEHLGRECQQSVGKTPEEVAAGLTDEERLVELTDLLTRAEEIRGRLERMGAVNILAVEQSQELEERHTFLVAQRQDLLDSIAELDQAIKKIDKTSKERFQEAFQVINQHFGEVFRQLFGGGTAGLSLIDEEDILESGIDVMAQPPGKRLQSVMLLSGGEKALTAIALLFSIFQYKPSPFCILDEVDAPLDDANIGRFVRMLEGLKDQTQFVLITHSRKTMEIADQLYGVTMEEPGVSKLVSVRLS